MFLYKDLPPQQHLPGEPFFSCSVCYFDNVGWVSISRFDSMIAACMFSTPKVAKSLAKSFFPLPFGPSYKELVFGECLPTYPPSVLLWGLFACLGGCLTEDDG